MNLFNRAGIILDLVAGMKLVTFPIVLIVDGYLDFNNRFLSSIIIFVSKSKK